LAKYIHVKTKKQTKNLKWEPKPVETHLTFTTKQAILRVWQKQWNKHDKCGQTKVFFNTINTKKWLHYWVNATDKK
jgi:hypothetical protein